MRVGRWNLLVFREFEFPLLFEHHCMEQVEGLSNWGLARLLIRVIF